MTDSPPAAEILLAEDDRVLRKALAAMLEKAGYRVRTARDGEEAVRMFRDRKPDVAVLDVMMPKTDGYGVCRSIRETDAETPVLFLTALDAESDELRGLGLGADDFIVKTASDEKILARIAAALRRASPEPPDGSFDFGPWRVDAARHRIVRDGEPPADLQEREIAILRWFASHPGEVFNRDFLMTRFWGADSEVNDNALTVAMYKLREKLGGEGAAIRSVRGVGYAYRPV